MALGLELGGLSKRRVLEYCSLLAQDCNMGCSLYLFRPLS